MVIQGKTVLITGGASGIGLEAARQFAKLGARVIVTGRNETKLQDAKMLYPELVIIRSDVSRADDALALYIKIESLGGIDILYNNAGVGVAPLNLGISNDAHFRGATYEMEVNYLGVVRLNDLFMDMLRSRKEGAIINTTSILSMVPSNLEATYSASKAALSFYTTSLREHLRILNSSLKIFELLPPLVATEMTAGREEKKITAKQLVNGLIAGLEKDQFTIRIGDAKTVHKFNRFFPKFTFRLINPKKNDHLLKTLI